jgi:hypothetical protein
LTRPFVPVLLNVLAALAGGFVASRLGVPLAWMLGAMAATAALAWFERAAVPQPVRPAALVLLGLGLGQTFTAPVMSAVAGAVPALFVGAVLSIGAGIAVAGLFTRRAGLDPRTAFFAAVPGGVVLMAVLAQRHGAQVAAVSLAQTVRVVTVVVLFPPLVTLLAPHGIASPFSAERPPVDLPGLMLLLPMGVGAAWVLHLLRIANPWMLGPCVLVIALAWFGLLPSGVPGWMVDAAQLGMGMALGQRLTRRFLLSSRRLALVSFVAALALSAAMAALALPFAWASALPGAAVVLGLAPGGMPEMTVTAKALDLAAPLVLAFHLVRTLVCNLLLGAVWRAVDRAGVIR